VDGLRRRNRRIRIAIAAAAIVPPLRMSDGLTPKNAGFHSTRSASLPGSTDPTTSLIPCAIAGLIVYFAT